MYNLLFVEHKPLPCSEIPYTLQTVWTYGQEDPTSHLLNVLIEQWDYTCNGDGSGSSLLANTPAEHWTPFPGLCDAIIGSAPLSQGLNSVWAHLAEAIHCLTPSPLQPPPPPPPPLSPFP